MLAFLDHGSVEFQSLHFLLDLPKFFFCSPDLLIVFFSQIFRANTQFLILANGIQPLLGALKITRCYQLLLSKSSRTSQACENRMGLFVVLTLANRPGVTHIRMALRLPRFHHRRITVLVPIWAVLSLQ